MRKRRKHEAHEAALALVCSHFTRAELAELLPAVKEFKRAEAESRAPALSHSQWALLMRLVPLKEKWDEERGRLIGKAL